MAQRHHGSALRRPLQPGKARVEPGRLLLIEDLQADHTTDVFVPSAPNLRHAALAGPTKQLKALADVDNRQLGFRPLRAKKQREDSHAPLLVPSCQLSIASHCGLLFCLATDNLQLL